MITLYGAMLSPFVRKVMMALAAKGLQYEQVGVVPSFGDTVPDNAPKDWKQISPLNKIPAIRDGDLGVSDSSVICEYLDHRYPDKPLFPSNLTLRARCAWYEEYADTEMTEVVLTTFRQRIVFPMMLGQKTDEAEVARSIKEDEPPIFDYLDKQLQGRDYFVGDALSMADISVVSPLINMHYAQHSIDAKRWKNLAAHYKRVIAVPFIANIMSKEQELLQGLQS